MSILVGKTSSLRPRTKIVKIINCNKSLNFGLSRKFVSDNNPNKKSNEVQITKLKFNSKKIYKNGKKINIPPDKVTDLFTNF